MRNQEDSFPLSRHELPRTPVGNPTMLTRSKAQKSNMINQGDDSRDAENPLSREIDLNLANEQNSEMSREKFAEDSSIAQFLKLDRNERATFLQKFQEHKMSENASADATLPPLNLGAIPRTPASHNNVPPYQLAPPTMQDSTQSFYPFFPNAHEQHESVTNPARTLSTRPNFNQPHQGSSFYGEITFQPFWKSDPEAWFAILESQFTDRGIYTDETRCWNLLKNLGPDVTREITGIVQSLPPGNKYYSLKAAVLEKFAEPPDQKLVRLFMNLQMGNRKPSEFLNEMFNLADGKVPRETILTVWKERLPCEILVALDGDIKDANAEKQIVKRADHVYDLYKRNRNSLSVNAVEKQSSSWNEDDRFKKLYARLNYLEKTVNLHESRFDQAVNRSYSANRSASRSSSRNRPHNHNNSGEIQSRPTKNNNTPRLCYYHHRFASRARHCTSPCSWVTKPKTSAAPEKPAEN